MQRGMGDKVPYFMQYMATFVTGVTIALVTGWKMTFVVLAAVPALVLSGAIFAKTLSEATMQGQAAYSKAGGIAEEVLGLIRTVAAFGSEEQEARRYDEQLEVAARDAKKRVHVSGLGMGVTFFIILCTYALAFWFGNKQVRNGSIASGDVLTVLFSVIIGAMGIGQGQPAVNAFNAARGCAPRIFAVIDRVSAIDPLDDEAGEVLDDVQGNLALEAVEFTYPTRQGETILSKMSVSVQRGQTLALVGPSGCGKVRFDCRRSSLVSRVRSTGTSRHYGFTAESQSCCCCRREADLPLALVSTNPLLVCRPSVWLARHRFCRTLRVRPSNCWSVCTTQ